MKLKIDLKLDGQISILYFCTRREGDGEDIQNTSLSLSLGVAIKLDLYTIYMSG